MIVDKAEVYFRSGRGGEGSNTFTSRGPHRKVACGGDGGAGGDVILKVSAHLYDLSKFQGKKKFIAGNGQSGSSNKKSGLDTADLIVDVPSGTRVIDAEGKLIVDLIDEQKSFVICRGGFGGKGNYKLKFSQPAKPGEQKQIILDYRIVNDAAIIGFPNSGKTSLFNTLCNQKAKVADYPFTTGHCHWAPCDYEFKRFVVLDTPPLKRRKSSEQVIEAGFLKHLFRSKIILLLGDSQGDFNLLKEEISLYSPGLLKGKKIFYLRDKVDKIDIDKLKAEILDIL